MAYALTNFAKNQMLDGAGMPLAAFAVYASLHTALPDSSGSNEASGGSPAYARQSISCGTAVGGIVQSTNTPIFDVPAGTYAFGGLWDSPTGGNFCGYAEFSSPFVAASQDTFTLLSALVSL
jgi:hypothetical protein